MLTTSQQVTLKAYILADPVLAPLTAGDGTDYGAIAAAMSADANPVYTVWRSSIKRDEIMQEGFDWTQVDNISTGQGRIWDWLFDNEQRSMVPSDPGKRAGVAEAWKGTAAKVAVATFVLGKCKRNARRVEALFATGAGTDVSPGTMGYEGEITVQDVAAMFNV